MRKILTTAVCVIVLPMITGCSTVRDNKPVGEENVISGTGVIKFIDLEGGFYGIVGDDGKNYDPLNLSQEFQVDALRVGFKAKTAEGVVGIRMWGTPIEILSIEKLE